MRLIGRPAAWMTMPNTESNSSGSTPPCTAELPPTWNRLNCTVNSTPSGVELVTVYGGISRLPHRAARAPGWRGRRPRAPRTGRAARPVPRRGRPPRSQVSLSGSADTARSCSRRIDGQERPETRPGLGRLRRSGSRRACRSPGRARRGSSLFAQALMAGQDVAAHDRLLAARSDADARNMGSGKLFEPQHVVARLGGQIVELARGGDVLPPAGQLLVDRLGAGDVALGHRHLVGALAVDGVADAHRHRLQARQHVELGQEVVGDAVDAGGVAGDDGVEPAAATGPAGRDADLAAGLRQVRAELVEQLGRERARADAGGVRLEDAQHRGDAGRPDAGARRQRRPRSDSTTSQRDTCRGRRRAACPASPRAARSRRASSASLSSSRASAMRCLKPSACSSSASRTSCGSSALRL